MTKDTKAEIFSNDDARTQREIKTVRLMINLFCRDQHGRKDLLCHQCLELFDYVRKRIEKCPLKDKKPTCSQCPVHCYKPDMRERIRRVMRYSGPRMIYLHPILTVRHYIKKIKKLI